MAERRLTVLVALGDADRAERLAAALERELGLAAVLHAEGDAAEFADAVVTDGPGVDGSVPHVVLGIASGAAGQTAPATLRADADVTLIAAAVRLVAAGYRIMTPSDRETGSPLDVLDHGEAELGPDEALQTALTPREREVLALLAEGAPNKVIARRLDISVHTAKFHVAAILVKLGAANRTDAIALAMRQGLVLI